MAGEWRVVCTDRRIELGDTFRNDRLPDLKTDYILANPPLNMKEWGGERLREVKRWKYGVPPVRNANFAWVQRIIHHLPPTAYAGVVRGMIPPHRTESRYVQG